MPVEFGDPNSAGVVGATFLFKLEPVDLPLEMRDRLAEHTDYEDSVLLANLDQAEASSSSTKAT